jgi:5-methylcytosine-specific restriction endonuclease McrA
MPIKPENKARYPANWNEIRQQILERAGHCCELCGVKNYALGAWIGNTWHKAHPKGTGRNDDPRPGGDFPCYADGDPHPVYTKVIRIVLTIMHLDHQPENNDPANLKAGCQRCHLRYDREHHKQNAARTRRSKQAISDMIDQITPAS